MSTLAKELRFRPPCLVMYSGYHRSRSPCYAQGLVTMIETQTYTVSSLRRVARHDRDRGEALEVKKRGAGSEASLGAVLQEALALPEAVVCGELRTDIDVREQDCDLQLRAKNSES